MSEQMKQLRLIRRKKGLCAACGKVKSKTYRCDNCKNQHVKKLKDRKIGNKRVWEAVEKYLIEYNTNLKDLAKSISSFKEDGQTVSSRSIHSWIKSNDILPKESNAKAFAKFFGRSISYFWPHHPAAILDHPAPYDSEHKLVSDPGSLATLRSKYPKPKQLLLAVQQIAAFIQNELGIKLDDREIAGIIEYYQIAAKLDDDAFYWFLEATVKTARRDPDKRNFRYLIGIIKLWVEYGYGYMPNKALDELIKLFRKKTSYSITGSSTNLLSTLNHKYGAVKVTEEIMNLKDSEIALFILRGLEKKLHENVVKVIDESTAPELTTEVEPKQETNTPSEPVQNQSEKTVDHAEHLVCS